MLHITTLRELLELSTSISPRFLVVDFHAQWCGPCKLVAPHFELLARRFSDIAAFAQVDVDVAEDVRDYAGISAMPTFHVYRGAERVFELVGANLPKLEAWLVQWGVRQAAAAPPPPPVAPPRAAPRHVLLQFDEGQLRRIKDKVLQFDAEVRQEGSDSALHPSASAALERLCDAVVGSSSGAAEVEDGLAAAHKALGWPSGRRWPLLDLLRLAVVRQPDAVRWERWLRVSPEQPTQLDVRAVLGTLSAGCDVEKMFALRLATNLLAQGKADPALSIVPLVLEAAAAGGVHSSARPGTQLALCTFLLNAAVLLRRRRADSEMKTPVVCALQQVLSSAARDTDEACRRAVLAVRTLAEGDVETAALCVGLDLHVPLDEIARAAGASAQLRECADEVRAILAGEASDGDSLADAGLYS